MTYLGNEGHENFIVHFWVVIFRILMAAEFHFHFNAIPFICGFLVLVLSVLGWLGTKNRLGQNILSGLTGQNDLP